MAVRSPGNWRHWGRGDWQSGAVDPEETGRRVSFLLEAICKHLLGITMISFPHCKYNSFFFSKKKKKKFVFKHKRSSEITNAQCWLHTAFSCIFF